MMNSKMFIVSGVNGVGKTTLIPFLQRDLDDSQFIVYDFDQRGVPDGADRTWRMKELNYWITVAAENARKGLSTIVCGFAKVGDFEESDVEGAPECELILLHADGETVRERLEGRYTVDGVFDENQKVIGKPISEFIAGNVWYSNKMLEEFKQHNGTIIDTSEVLPEDVAKKVVSIIRESTEQ